MATNIRNEVMQVAARRRLAEVAERAGEAVENIRSKVSQTEQRSRF